MTPETAEKIKTLKTYEEIDGWRWAVSETREYEDGEQAALVAQEIAIKERRV